jgi:hypothetical protein
VERETKLDTVRYCESWRKREKREPGGGRGERGWGLKDCRGRTDLESDRARDLWRTETDPAPLAAKRLAPGLWTSEPSRPIQPST